MQPQSGEDITLEGVVIKLKKAIVYLKARWIGFLITTLLGIAGGIIYSYLSSPKYTATLSFVLEDDRQSGGGGILSQFGLDVGGLSGGGGAFSAANIGAFMKSRYLLEKTLLRPMVIGKNNTCLAEVYIDSMGIRQKWKDPELKKIHFLPGSDYTQFTFKQVKVLGDLCKMIVAENLIIGQADKKSSLMAIEVTTKNEVFSKIFAETISDVVSHFYIETKSKKAKTNVEILEKQADSLRIQLNDAISDVASLNDNNYNLNPAINRKKSSFQQRTIDVQVNTALLSQIVQNLEIARLTLLKETPLIQVIDRPVYPLPKMETSLKLSIIIGAFLGVFVFFLYILIVLFMQWYKQLVKI